MLERFIVWMRIAGSSQFKKLYGVIRDDLTPGKYYFKVQDNYDVSAWLGRKFIGISTSNTLGGSNYNLAICYCVLAFTSFIFMTISIIYKIHENKMNERKRRKYDEKKEN